MTPDEFIKARHKLGLSTNQLAGVMQVDPVTVRRWEMHPNSASSRDVPTPAAILIDCLVNDKEPPANTWDHVPGIIRVLLAWYVYEMKPVLPKGRGR